MKYYVLTPNCTPAGPFKSIAAAEKVICNDALETLDAGLEHGLTDADRENYFDEHAIVQVVKVVRPIPTIKTSISLTTL